MTSISYERDNHKVDNQALTETKCTVQPVSVTPASSACLWACMPLKDGSRDGWILRRRPCHLLTNSPVRMRMNPARQMSSMPASSSACVRAASNSCRDL